MRFERDDEDGRGLLTRGQFLVGGGVAGAALLGLPVGTDRALGAIAAPAPPGAHHFVSRRDLRPPKLAVRHHTPTPVDELFFIAPSSGPGQRGVMIFDRSGEPVWFHPTTPVTAMNFRVSSLKGKPVLTWWEGKSEQGLGRGVYVIADTSYREIARIRAGGYADGDLHEFLITPAGTALVTKNEYAPRDLRAFGGGSGDTVVGGVVQEIEIPSGRVLFEWRSLDHVALDESYVGPSAKHFDYFHINSVDVDADGHLLVSARHTWAAYKVHRRTGQVIWRLGGRRSDFAMGRGTVTSWQHDVRSQAGGRIVSIFDNGAAPQVQTQSRVLFVRLDTASMRASLVRSLTHRPGRIVSRFMGGAQVLANGHTVVGWGSEPFVTEFDAAGRIRFEVSLPKGGQNYRAFRFPWQGTPIVRPKLAAGISGGRRGLFASWNGATDVAYWQLRYGPAAGDLQNGPETPRAGFETRLERPAGARVVEVLALDRNRRPLRRSAPLRL